MKKFLPLLVLLFALPVAALSGIAEDASALAKLQLELKEANSDAERLAADSLFTAGLRTCISQAESFNYPFEELQYMYKGKSPDGKFRLYNWNVPLENGDHNYHCFVQFKNNKNELVVQELSKAKRPHKKPEMASLKEDQWIPALYYEIVPIKRGKKNIYTLIGWDGADRYINRKIVDVLSFQGEKIRFGAAIFKMKMGIKKRLIFEYADEVSMSVRFHPKQKEIVFDHLSPRQPGLEGNPAFYGPDLSFDAIRWKKGKWLLEEDVEINQRRDGTKRKYNDPSKR